MKRFIIAIGLTLLAAAPANAQQQQRFVEIGQESDTGLPVLLDRNSVRQNRFNLISKYGDGFMLVRHAIIDCQNRIGRIEKIETYDESNRLISADSQPSERMNYGEVSNVARAAREAGICKN